MASSPSASSSSTNENEDHEKRVKTEAQLEAIESEIKKTQELTSTPRQVQELRSSYDKGSNFDKGIQYLMEIYSTVRIVRGDGNCYYRAFLYSLCENLLLANNKEELQRITHLVKESIDQVTNQGYDRFAIEMFHEEFVELLDSITTTTTANELHTKLNEDNATSDYCTWYMRLLTATHLKADPDRFVPYLDAATTDNDLFVDIPTFCSREVEPMGRECGMVQVLALAEAIGVHVTIEYLDGHNDLTKHDNNHNHHYKLTKHDFGNSEQDGNDNDNGNNINNRERTHLILLYRPGHYDILYK